MGRIREQATYLAQGVDRGCQGASVIIIVETVQKGSVLGHHSHLGGGGACVNAQIAVPFIGCQVAGLYMVAGMAAGEFFIVGLILKQGLHALYLNIHLDA